MEGFLCEKSRLNKDVTLDYTNHARMDALPTQ